jgi:hypothetical protein
VSSAPGDRLAGSTGRSSGAKPRPRDGPTSPRLDGPRGPVAAEDHRAPGEASREAARTGHGGEMGRAAHLQGARRVPAVEGACFAAAAELPPWECARRGVGRAVPRARRPRCATRAADIGAHGARVGTEDACRGGRGRRSVRAGPSAERRTRADAGECTGNGHSIYQSPSSVRRRSTKSLSSARNRSSTDGGSYSSSVVLRISVARVAASLPPLGDRRRILGREEERPVGALAESAPARARRRGVAVRHHFLVSAEGERHLAISSGLRGRRRA